VRHAVRNDLGRDDGQHDALRRGDDLAPVARRQLSAHPTEHPPGHAERVAHQPEREHPRTHQARDVDTEHQDQERVGLPVEAGAERRGAGTPREPAVDRVQHERDRGDCDQRRHLRLPDVRLRGERRDRARQERPAQRHHIRRPEHLETPPQQRTGHHRQRTDPAAQPDEPAERAQPDGCLERGEQRHLTRQADDRAASNREHRASPLMGTALPHLAPPPFRGGSAPLPTLLLSAHRGRG
jgi:hypothetical protein